MPISDKKLTILLALQPQNDADQAVRDLAYELQMARAEVKQLKSTFVPIHYTVDRRLTTFIRSFEALCMEQKVRAACVCPYGTPDGELLLHVAGETNVATLVRKMLHEEKR